MSILGWIAVGIAFVGLHLVMHRGHSILGGGRGHGHGSGGCCGGHAGGGPHEGEHPHGVEASQQEREQP